MQSSLRREEARVFGLVARVSHCDLSLCKEVGRLVKTSGVEYELLSYVICYGA